MRPEKQLIVEEVGKQIGSSPFLLLTDYTGLTVENFTELRKRLAAAGAECHVVKNTLLQRAIATAGLPAANGSLTGMTAMVVGGSQAEITAVAKIIKQFTKDTTKSKVKLGYMGAEKLGADQVAVLADLPAKDVLRAQFVGLLQTPATRLAVILAAPGGQIARVLKAYADKKAE